MMYKDTTTIVCFMVLISALDMKGSRFRSEKLALLPCLKSTTPDILPLVHIDLHICVYVYTSTMKGKRWPSIPRRPAISLYTRIRRPRIFRTKKEREP
ncbi:hypothetical protein X777_12058 [Ooceraea biroi]|uniref:Uncharacterized protein n=1 Tax=Ooceraea biroi TaxID=2015173 RepID=A0A026X014_OOCBI|nr:hypothetical protein X777_12058 [Ooceraea biroi]